MLKFLKKFLIKSKGYIYTKDEMPISVAGKRLIVKPREEYENNSRKSTRLIRRGRV